MISIDRGPCPTVLQPASTHKDYAHDDVVQALWDMQCGKCCYCEQHIADMGQGQHVEHFRPKSRPEFAHLRNSWSNLLLACPMCNGQKSEQFPEDGRGRAILIDPSAKTIHPEKHIEFIVDDGDDDPTGLPAPRTPRGRKTVEVIGLWLPHYVRLRRRHFRMIVRPRYMKLLNAKGNGDANQWATAKSEFEELLTGLSPFVSFVRCFARRKCLDKIGIDIPGGACREAMAETA
jgi:uncharacterized protein (TIGR02646 family)